MRADRSACSPEAEAARLAATPEEVADDVLSMLKLAPGRAIRSAGYAFKDDLEDWRDLLVELLEVERTPREEAVLRGLQAAAIFYACRSHLSFAKAAGPLSRLQVSPALLRELVQLTRAEESQDVEDLLREARGEAVEQASRDRTSAPLRALSDLATSMRERLRTAACAPRYRGRKKDYVARDLEENGFVSAWGRPAKFETIYKHLTKLFPKDSWDARMGENLMH